MEKKTKKTQSLYIDTELWQEAKLAAGDADVSLIVTKLLKMWLSKQVTVVLEPVVKEAIS